MTVGQSSGYLKRTEKSQRVAQREVMGTDKIWESSAYKMVFNPCNWMKSPIERVWLSKTRILRIKHWVKHLEFSREEAVKESPEGDIIEAMR